MPLRERRIHYIRGGSQIRRRIARTKRQPSRLGKSGSSRIMLGTTGTSALSLVRRISQRSRDDVDSDPDRTSQDGADVRRVGEQARNARTTRNLVRNPLSFKRTASAVADGTRDDLQVCPNCELCTSAKGGRYGRSDSKNCCHTFESIRRDYPNVPLASTRKRIQSVMTSPPQGNEYRFSVDLPTTIIVKHCGVSWKFFLEHGSPYCKKHSITARIRRKVSRFQGASVFGVGFSCGPPLADDIVVEGSPALAKALSGKLGPEICVVAYGWGLMAWYKINPASKAAHIFPEATLGGNLTVQCALSAVVCSRMLYARTDEELFFLPGPGFPCFKVVVNDNGRNVKLEESEALPRGVELCSAETLHGFGSY